MNVLFAHGKESGPWGTKISALAAIARQKGFSFESPDYSEQSDPDARVEQLLTLRLPASDLTILVGSSMGGYVATVASQIINPVGIFLMAPAFYLPGYKEQSPDPSARKTVIIHGLKDEVVPVENSIRFAREHGTELHLIDGDHSLNDQLPKIEMLFDQFLDEVLELSDFTSTLTWEKISLEFGKHDEWVKCVWEKIVLEGHANYKNRFERRNILLRFIALINFYSEFLSEFSREYCKTELYDTSDFLYLPIEVLDNLFLDFLARGDHKFAQTETIRKTLEESAKTFVYPTMIKCFGDIEGLAESIYNASYPTCFNIDIDDGLMDPDIPDDDNYVIETDDLDVEEYAKAKACRNINNWLKQKFGLLGETHINLKEEYAQRH